jgi:hypothetical protein
MPHVVATFSRAPLRRHDITCQIKVISDSTKAADEMHKVRITGPVYTGAGGGFTTQMIVTPRPVAALRHAVTEKE